MMYALTQQGVFEREHDFDAFEQIARHPIGTAQINFLLAAIREIKNSTVLEETAHDAANPNPIANAANAGTKGAHSAHDQINIHACLRSPVKSHDHAFIEQRIHLGDDVRGT